jgi:putative FmdB family regulatory protein
MTYGYDCPSCQHSFDVIKSVKDIDINESCPKCGEFAVRQFCPERLYLSKTAVTHAEYNPGLGCVVKKRRT